MSSSIRYNTFSKVHRGLRAAMAEALTAVGRTDPEEESQVETTLAGVEALLQLCECSAGNGQSRRRAGAVARWAWRTC